MKTLRIVSSILTFIESNMLFIFIFSLINYIIFNGEEKSGNLVTIITISFFVLCITASSLISRKIYIYLKRNTLKRNLISFIIILVTLIGTMLLFNLSSYIISVDQYQTL